MLQNAVLIAGIDRMSFGSGSLSTTDMTASELASGWSPITQAEALLLFTKALSLFHHGCMVFITIKECRLYVLTAAQRLRNEMDARGLSLSIPAIQERALVFKAKFDDCVTRVDRLRSDISNDSYYKSVVAKGHIILSVEELLIEYAKRLCREAVASEV